MKKTILTISGMHCPSCNILIKEKFASLKNVKKVKADFKTQKAEVYYEGNLNVNKLDKLISPFGYQIVKNNIKEEFGGLSNWLDFFLILIIIILVYLIAKDIDIWPSFNYQSLSLPMVFLLGMIASASTCMATAGALYLAIAEKNSHWQTAVSFSVGRVFAYSFFGFLFGFLGKVLTSSLFFSSLLTIFIALMMIFLGLELAKVFSWQKFFGVSFFGKIFEFFEEKLSRYPRKMPFFLGAITYFLPCGFTQSIQVYSMGLGNPWLSSINMTVFAIGTIPLILLINQVKTIRQFNFYHYFLKTAGVLVFIVGLYYLTNVFSLYGINLDFFNSNKNKKANVSIINGKQEIKMIVDASGYNPNYFQVKRGVPVRWIIEGKNVLGCQGYFVVKQLGINQALKPGENIFEFTPKDNEPIYFSCGMGMYKGEIEVIN